METRKRMVIDLLSGANPDCVHTVQGDAYSRVVELELKAGRQNWPVPEDASVLVEYVKSDGTKGVYDTLPDGSAAWSAEGNVLSLTLAPQMLTVSGAVTAQVRLIQGERLLSLFAFRIYVHNKLAGGGTSEDYFSWRCAFLPQVSGSAAVGQHFVVEEVDSSGQVTKIRTVNSGVKPVSATEDMTQPVGMDADGLLYTDAYAKSKIDAIMGAYITDIDALVGGS